MPFLACMEALIRAAAAARSHISNEFMGVESSSPNLLLLQRQDRRFSSHQAQDCEFFLWKLGCGFVLSPVVDWTVNESAGQIGRDASLQLQFDRTGSVLCFVVPRQPFWTLL